MAHKHLKQLKHIKQTNISRVRARLATRWHYATTTAGLFVVFLLRREGKGELLPSVGQTVFSEPGNPAIEEIEAFAKNVLELLP